MTALIVNAHNPVDASAGPLSKPLPTGAPAGSEVSVEKYDLTANTVTVTGSIRGVAAQSIVLSLGREALSFRADSAGSWWPVSGHKTLSSLTALFVTLASASKNPDLLITGAITRDANDVITSAAVVWPDGSPGTFTTDTIDTSGAINAYHITYGSPATRTFTQPTMTRNANGAVTALPAIVVS